MFSLQCGSQSQIIEVDVCIAVGTVFDVHIYIHVYVRIYMFCVARTATLHRRAGSAGELRAAEDTQIHRHLRSHS
jgi:hypothetical protein